MEGVNKSGQEEIVEEGSEAGATGGTEASADSSVSVENKSVISESNTPVTGSNIPVTGSNTIVTKVSLTTAASGSQIISLENSRKNGGADTTLSTASEADKRKQQTLNYSAGQLQQPPEQKGIDYSLSKRVTPGPPVTSDSGVSSATGSPIESKSSSSATQITITPLASVTSAGVAAQAKGSSLSDSTVTSKSIQPPTQKSGGVRQDNMASRLSDFAPNCFFGKIESECPISWFKSFRDYLSFHKIADNFEASLGMMKLLTRQTARLWLDNNSYYDLDSLERAFIRDFSKLHSREAQLTALDELKLEKDMQLSKYLFEIRKLTSALGLTDRTVEDQFIRGLPIKVRNALRFTNFSNFNELFAKAQEFVEILKPFEEGRGSFLAIQESMEADNQLEVKQGKKREWVKQCYACHGFGHIARECGSFGQDRHSFERTGCHTLFPYPWQYSYPMQYSHGYPPFPFPQPYVNQEWHSGNPYQPRPVVQMHNDQ